MPISTNESPPSAYGPLVLVAGGETDPNLHLLLRRLSVRGVRSFAVQVGPGSHPTVTWDLRRDTLVVDGMEIRPTAAYVRYDVFAWRRDRLPATAERANAWFATVMGWLRVHGEVRRLNARQVNDVSKPHALHVAREVGLEVPDTVVSNDLPMLRSQAGERTLVGKPVQGGDYCREIGEVLEAGAAAGPAFSPVLVQPRLEQPEVRVYRIGSRFLAFSMVSDLLDYRAEPTCTVVPLPLEEVPSGLLEGLGRLTDHFGMDFGAADFKTDPETGRLLFLELNNGPMCAVFDRVSDGAVFDAVVDLLLGREGGASYEVARLRPAATGCVECGKAAAGIA